MEKILFQSAEKIRRETIQCFTNSGYRKILCLRGLRHDFRFSVENFLSHSAYNFRRGILYCCGIFGYRKSLDKMWGEYQQIPSEMFCLAVSKKFAGETLCAVFQKFSGSEKFMDKGGEYEDFPSEFFSLTVAKIFIG